MWLRLQETGRHAHRGEEQKENGCDSGDEVLTLGPLRRLQRTLTDVSDRRHYR